MNGKVIALSGGVGGAKLVLGLSHVVDSDKLLVVCNTSDDFQHLGLTICPDIDSVLYAVSGLSDQQRGWGRKNETWAFMSALRDLGGPDWFNLGDGDLAMHVLRSELLRRGKTLSGVTAELASRMGIATTILPMSDFPVSTVVHTATEDLAFQHYFVREQCAPRVTGFTFDGIEQASPQVKLLEVLATNPEAIIIAPSNPYVSIDPILELPGLRKALKAADAPIVAVSPIVGGAALKGPAAKMMQELGKDVSVFGIAQHYQGLIDGLVIDAQDARLASAIEDIGIATFTTSSVMTDLADRIALARDTFEFACGLRR